MGASTTILPFAPQFLFPTEYAKFGLPSAQQQPDIDNLVAMASETIDNHCMRKDGDGFGSLVYTTYTERILMQSPGRSLLYLPHKPLAAVPASTLQDLQTLASGTGEFGGVAGAENNCFYTGALPAINTLCSGSQSAIISASGRYTQPRRDTYALGSDLNSYTNPYTLSTLFGGPPPWTPIDMSNLDYDVNTGEVWVAAGIYLEKYTEVIFTYTSGYDPRQIPRAIKLACAAIVKNMLPTGGTTGMKRFTAVGISTELDPNIVDMNVQRLLQPFVSIRAY